MNDGRSFGCIFERVAGITFTSLGAAALFEPFSISPFLGVLFSSRVAAVIFFVVGSARLAMSVFAPQFALLRITLSLCCAVLWGQWAVVLLIAVIHEGVLRPGLFHISAMVYGELTLIYWIAGARLK